MSQATLAHRPPAGPIILTYDEYAELPSDGRRYEIIEGDLFVTPAPRPKHQNVVGNLHGILFNYLRDHPIGKLYLAPIDLILSPTNVVQPDMLFLSQEKYHFVSDRGIEGPPDLIVEVLSPTTEKTDRTTKSRLYARFGVTQYWLIDPTEKRLEMFRLAGGRFHGPLKSGVNITPALFPNLSFPRSDLWR